MDKARYLITLWTQVVKAEVKADFLEAKLTWASKGQRSVGATEKKSPRNKHGPSAIREVHGSSGAMDKAHLRGYNLGFKV